MLAAAPFTTAETSKTPAVPPQSNGEEGVAHVLWEIIWPLEKGKPCPL